MRTMLAMMTIPIFVLGLFASACTSPPLIPPSNPSRSSLWWNPRLDLIAIDAIDARMDRLWPDAFELPPGSDSPVNPTTSEQVQSCRGFLAAHARGLGPQTELELHVWREAGALCRALELVRQARPYTQPCLPEAAYDATVLTRLPADMALVLSPDDISRRHAAAEQALSWHQYQPELKVVSSQSLRLELEDALWRASVEWMVAGDLDGDGDEDRVAIVIGALKEGTLQQVRVVTLACDKEAGRYRMMKDEVL